jgi:hypothetical protein
VNPHQVFRLCLLAGFVSLPLSVGGQQPTEKNDVIAGDHARPHELAGFLLRQDRKAFEAALGKPFHEQEGDDGARVLAFHLPNSKDDYLIVFVFYGKNKESEQYGKAVQLELTGDEPYGPTGFYGLQLGDSVEKVEKALGKPSSIRHEDDANVDLWDYHNSNYSIEITPDHKLYSIQIIDQNTETPPQPAGAHEVRLFAQAFQSGDLDRVVEMASGEIECSTSDTFGIRAGSARTLLANPNSPISACLKRAADAVLALGPDLKGADDEVRIWERHSAGTVTKFPASSPLAEIVFDEEAGAWRVYEVTFRAAAK